MRSSEYPYLADWFVISLRWLTLLGMTAALAIWMAPPLGFLITVLILAVFNVLMTVVAMYNRRLPLHRGINLTADIVCGALIFNFSGALTGPLPWASLLPIFTAAIYFEWLGGLLVGIFFSVVQIAVTFQGFPQANSLVPNLLLALANIGGGALLGLLGKRLVWHFRNHYLEMVNQRKEFERRLQRQVRSRMQVFYQMTEALSSTLNYQVVLDAALDLSASALGETDDQDRLVRAILLFTENDLAIGAYRHLPSRDARMTFAAARGVLHDVIQNGEPKLLRDPFTDPELRQLVAIESCRSALVLPLRRGLNAFGAMLFAHASPDFFTPAQTEMLEMISHQAVIAIQNARLFQDLENEKERILETQEEARKKLARDLHDGPTQSVAAIAMQLNIARTLIKTDPKQALEELAQIEDLARRTTKEIRHMLFTLRPLVLENEGLVAALNAMAAKMREVFQQNVTVQADEKLVEDLELGRQTVIFYIIEEALNNARKHAKAKEIIVRLYHHPKASNIGVVEVADNGVGFDVNAVMAEYEKRGSLGMVNLQERSELIEGLLQVESVVGKGTRVRVLIPLDDAAKDRLQRGDISKLK